MHQHINSHYGKSNKKDSVAWALATSSSPPPTYALDAPGLIHYLQTVPNPKQTKSNLKLLVQNYLRQYENIKLLVQHTFPHAKIIVLYAPVIEEKFTKMFSTPTQTPCYNNGYGYEVYNRQIGPVCPNPNQHVFFDNYFYSSAIQNLFSKYSFHILLKKGWISGETTKRHWWQRL